MKKNILTGYQSVFGMITNALAKVICTLRIWRIRARQRRELAGLSSHLLKDLGLTRNEQWREVNKPFWRE